MKLIDRNKNGYKQKSFLESIDMDMINALANNIINKDNSDNDRDLRFLVKNGSLICILTKISNVKDDYNNVSNVLDVTCGKLVANMIINILREKKFLNRDIDTMVVDHRDITSIYLV